MKNKKILWIILGVLDVAVVTFLFVIHIIMLANIIGKTPIEVQQLAQGEGLIAFLVGNLNVYGFAFVIPLFVILIANVVGLYFYMKKNLKKEKANLSDLSEEEKEALKKELLKDLENK